MIRFRDKLLILSPKMFALLHFKYIENLVKKLKKSRLSQSLMPSDIISEKPNRFKEKFKTVNFGPKNDPFP